jgi:uncharacterized protein YggE
MLSRALGFGLLSVLSALPTASADEGQRNLITVEGQAEVRVKPDKVRIVMVAEQRAASLPQAEGAVKASTETILSLVHTLGVTDADIDASDYGLQPIYNWSDGKKLAKRLGVRVRRTLVVTLRDLSRFGPLLSAIVETGAVSVASVDPEIEETRAHRDQARLLAVRAAREKAEAVAAELGQTIGRATTIEVDGASSALCCGAAGEKPWAGLPNRVYSNVGSSEEAGPDYELGAITLTARVKVAFELK